ncbi:MATE family efflux transporter [Glaciecola sp. XM2]|uniref:MATE family efflux transporter n=1 Tax=Glaciecola sp. XM2 TaxID=1914931 RepID=UPI0020321D1D|nr:MATE family efflux transporter [Glaciecola sp. XM2]
MTQAKHPHIALLSIAIPLILANITTPLLGLVDTAILGRMDGMHFLAGAAIASLILTQVYWVCGFLKMSMTGLSAQAIAKSEEERCKTLAQGGFLALVLAGALLILQTPLLQAGLWLSQVEVNVAQSTSAYFAVRVWGAPAALINLALIGYLIGQQRGRLILMLQVFVNLINIAASLALVYLLGLGVEGVALGTVIAEYSMTLAALWIIHTRHHHLYMRKAWLSFAQLKPLLSLNTDMLVRNLALQFTIAFIVLRGAQFGTQAAAINAILMQFFALIALGLDGIANAVESLVGEQHGKKNTKALITQVKIGLIWSSIVAVIYSLIFWIFSQDIMRLLTNQAELIVAAQQYVWVIIALPLVAHWCFLFDGVYVGMTQGKSMRNNMLMSTLLGFLPSYVVLSAYGNQALWFAMLVFLGFRGLGLGGHFVYYYGRLSTSAN